MGVLLKNNAVSRLSSSIGTGVTALSVTSGQGALFPAPTGGDWFPVTVIKATGVLEVMKCTARTGDVLTVERAQESTAAQAFTVGDRVELRLTAGAMAEVIAQITALADAALLNTGNLAELTNVPEARDNLALGTAAVADVTTSHTDTTAGHLLQVGDFGLGVFGGGPLITDLNAATVSGDFRYAGDAALNPLPGSGGSLKVSNLGGNHVQQIAMTLDTSTHPVIYARHFDADGNPGAWVLLFHSGNLTADLLAIIFGYKPVQQGTGVGQFGNAVKLGWDNINSLRATVDATDLGRLWTEAVFKRPDAGFVLIAGSTVLPAGGTWAYFYTFYNGSGQALGGAANLAAGGTTLPAGNLVGFAWRFA